MNRGEHTATLHHGTSRIDPLPRTRVNTGETGGGLLLSVGPRVRLPSGTPASNAENLYSRRCIYKSYEKSLSLYEINLNIGMYIERLFSPHRGWIGALFMPKTMGNYKRSEIEH